MSKTKDIYSVDVLKDNHNFIINKNGVEWLKMSKTANTFAEVIINLFDSGITEFYYNGKKWIAEKVMR